MKRRYDPDEGTCLLEKVISGGQKGADKAGIEAAWFYGIPTGGVAPAGFMTANGPDLSLRDQYGLIELENKGPPPPLLSFPVLI